MRRVAVVSACLTLITPVTFGRQPPAQSRAESVRADFLHVIARPAAPLAPSSPAMTTTNGFVQELVSFASEPDERVPVLIIRKGGRTGRAPVVVALHGTGGSKEGMRSLLETYADRGFIAVAMDARHHGERAKPIAGLPNAYQSAMLRAYRTGEGHPYLYDTVWDVMRLLDYLTTRPDVDPKRIGVIGNSRAALRRIWRPRPTNGSPRWRL